ncbi:SPOR domain-containing protein [Pontivivens insulae]|uniref:Cell division protein FtsN n=1 Tax=Pontivivens insulae TaxID=1639689 RepID=A0A2R8ACG5_9RHOB|nr:SPOR domain-containing protein [Pontivivens insulae]RED13835.1 sporulation related protein [Pontivivens insulae]SPF29909.1 Cell division protein FtsN [Pontivivens insulae]
MRDTASEQVESVSLLTKVGRVVGALASLAVLIGLAMWTWQTGTQDTSEIPVIVAQSGPAREEPEEPGGLQVPHQGRSVNTLIEGTPDVVTEEDVALAPAPMVPDQEDVVIAPDPAQEIEDLLAEALGDGGEDTGVAAEPDPEADPYAPVASLIPRSRPSDLASRTTTAVREPQAPVAVDGNAIPAGTHMVQLGAFLSEEIAIEQWNGLVRRQPSLMAGKQRYIETVVSGGTTRYRLRAVGYDGLTETRAACAAFVARGQDCIPVTR